MTNKKILNRLAQIKTETFRQARIAAVNKLKQSIVYHWRRKNQPAMFFFPVHNLDKDIVNIAVEELMQQYSHVYFICVYEDNE